MIIQEQIQATGDYEYDRECDNTRSLILIMVFIFYMGCFGCLVWYIQLNKLNKLINNVKCYKIEICV
jgi:hypothetical protein